MSLWEKLAVTGGVILLVGFAYGLFAIDTGKKRDYAISYGLGASGVLVALVALLGWVWTS